jgi:hypothetical protein
VQIAMVNLFYNQIATVLVHITVILLAPLSIVIVIVGFALVLVGKY